MRVPVLLFMTLILNIKFDLHVAFGYVKFEYSALALCFGATPHPQTYVLVVFSLNVKILRASAFAKLEH